MSKHSHFVAFRYNGRAVAAATPSTFTRLMQVRVCVRARACVRVAQLAFSILFSLLGHSTPPPPVLNHKKHYPPPPLPKLHTGHPGEEGKNRNVQPTAYARAHAHMTAFARFCNHAHTSIPPIFSFRGISNIARRKPAARIPLPFGTSSLAIMQQQQQQQQQHQQQRPQSAAPRSSSLQPGLHPDPRSLHAARCC